MLSSRVMTGHLAVDPAGPSKQSRSKVSFREPNRSKSYHPRKIQQATFCVNSLAHWLGEQPFDDRNTPRDHFLTALIQNFHHEFPSDYRNAIEWHQYDPTKWFIWTMKKLGLAYDLKQFSPNAIELGRIQQAHKALDKKRLALDKKRSLLDCGIPIAELPIMDWDDYKDQIRNGRHLIMVAGPRHIVLLEKA
ncbi:stearoyl-CoA desaturase (Delta-9 desaturase), partial [Lecanoromycetidae sp. Uapishka_2]